ncbi:MAG: hypothetical protein IPP79_20650 [Chitinophagaceae bacterium]|nr:hypothetical protein [Chitinophagaceae bacterium]
MLRAGFYATGDNDLLQIDLSSNRVNKALWYLDGIRNGQELGALLGYQFERGLHDNGLDQYIFDFRGDFPLGVGALVPNTRLSTETIQANNVVDGYKMIKQWRLSLKDPYPSFISFSLMNNDNDVNDTDPVKAQILLLEDALDAISDLVISEGVFQLAKGNYVRSAAVQKAFNESKPIPELEIVQTPRTGTPLTHRTGILLEASNNALPAAWLNMPITPRAQTEPILNRWLAEQMGNPANIVCGVRYELRSDLNSEIISSVSLLDLHLNPIDILFFFCPLLRLGVRTQ